MQTIVTSNNLENFQDELHVLIDDGWTVDINSVKMMVVPAYSHGGIMYAPAEKYFAILVKK